MYDIVYICYKDMRYAAYTVRHNSVRHTHIHVRIRTHTYIVRTSSCCVRLLCIICGLCIQYVYVKVVDVR